MSRRWERSGGNEDYGNAARSGKMLVLERVLRLWLEQGHRCLLFTQTQQMLDILEALVCTLGMSYRRMDGNTAIGSRMVSDPRRRIPSIGGVRCTWLLPFTTNARGPEFAGES
jgi:SNF2 family DNA or RNA helicase